MGDYCWEKLKWKRENFSAKPKGDVVSGDRYSEKVVLAHQLGNSLARCKEIEDDDTITAESLRGLLHSEPPRAYAEIYSAANKERFFVSFDPRFKHLLEKAVHTADTSSTLVWTGKTYVEAFKRSETPLLPVLTTDWKNDVVLAFIEYYLVAYDPVSCTLSAVRDTVAQHQRVGNPEQPIKHIRYDFHLAETFQNHLGGSDGIVVDETSFYHILEAIVEAAHLVVRQDQAPKQRLTDALKEVGYKYPNNDDQIVRLLDFVEHYAYIAAYEASLVPQAGSVQIMIKEGRRTRREMVPATFPFSMESVSQYTLGLLYKYKYFIQDDDGESYKQILHRFA